MPEEQPKNPERDSRVLPGMLYVVATPIGHLDDISRRAVDVLSGVEIIAAEDTRRTRALLSALGLPRPKLIALHDHNEDQISESIVRSLVDGAKVALVSDAGTPLLSDPGFNLVQRCFEAGIGVIPVPGPSAVIAALSVCPLPVSGVRLLSFLPARSGPRRASLTRMLESGEPVLFFEAPHRLRECLSDLASLAPDRRVFVAREMTKRFETYLADTPGRLISQMDAQDQWRGEIVCILEGAAAGDTAGPAEQQRIMRILRAELAPAQAARIGARILGVKKKALYDLVTGPGASADGGNDDER